MNIDVIRYIWLSEIITLFS